MAFEHASPAAKSFWKEVKKNTFQASNRPHNETVKTFQINILLRASNKRKLLGKNVCYE